MSSLDSFNRKEAEEEEGEDSVCLKKKKKSVILKEKKFQMKKQKTNKLAFCALIENTLPSHIILQYERKRELLSNLF